MSREPIFAGDTVTYNYTKIYEATASTNVMDPPSISCELGVVASTRTMRKQKSSIFESSVQVTASGCEVPAFRCSSNFPFTKATNVTATERAISNHMNGLTYACSFPRVPVWCKYLQMNVYTTQLANTEQHMRL